MPQAARIHDGHLELRGTPHQQLVAWLEEFGIDLQLEVETGFWIDSSPPRYAREPLRLALDDAGSAHVPVRIREQQSAARLRLIGRCDESERAAGLVDRYARLRASTLVGDPNAVTPLQMLAASTAGVASSQAGTWTHRWFMHQLASLARSAGMMVEAAAWYQRATEAADAAGDPVWAALARLGHGQALFVRGDKAGEAVLRDAKERAGATGLMHPETVATHDLCLVQRVSGRIEEAADCLRLVAERHRILGELPDVGIAQRNRANALMMLSRYAEAREALQVSADIAAKLDDVREQSLVWRMQANLARWGGDLDQALDLLRKALQGLNDDIVEHAQTLRMIADTYLVAGQPVRALGYYQQAHASLVSRKAFNRSAYVEVMMARTHLQLQQPDRARALLSSAREHLLEFGSANRIAGVQLELAQLQLESGRDEDARESLMTFEARGTDGLTWQQLAQADVLRVKLDPGMERSVVERDLGAHMARALTGRQLLLFLDIAEALLEYRLGRADAAAARELALMALDIVENVAGRIRSPGLRHALLSRLRPFAMIDIRLLSDGPVSEASVLGALSPLERLRALEQQSTTHGPSPDQFDDLERMLSAEALNGEVPRSEDRNAAVLALDAAAAGTGKSADLVPLALPSIAPGEFLLYFVANGTQLGAFVGDDAGWRWHGALDGAAAQYAASELQASLAAGHGSGDQAGMLQRVATALSWPALLPRDVARLSIVTDGALAGVPWELLPASGVVGEIVLLQSLRPRDGRTPASIMAIAAASQASSDIPELQRADGELDRVLAIWSNLPAQRLGRTSQQQFELAVAQQAGLVHVATHGRGDQGLAEDAGLWLLDTATGAPRFLSAVRIRHMPVGAALVVLSACDTGYGLAGRGFGMGGVAGSLVDAGADTVIGARWPVSDRAAQVFSEAFHEALARHPAAPARAVRSAQEAVRRVPALRHPTHWAAWFALQSGPKAAGPRQAAPKTDI
jgi:tetratricopeptide (TPR) repeat protein